MERRARVRRKTAIRGLLALTGTVCLLAASDPLPAAGPTPAPPLSSIYLPTPSYTSTLMGFFSTGVAFVDLNGDGYKDMVLANGNDMSPQPLTVYYNRGGQTPVFPARPDWFSEDFDYQGKLVVGDLNGDGWPDVAVAVAFDHSRNPATGGVKVYLNHGGRLDSKPSYRTGGGFVVLGFDLGDVDGDGDLDLVAAVLSETAGGAPLQPGRARIYLKPGGVLSSTPAWTSRDGLGAGDAVVADVNQDGWMDLAFSSSRTTVFYGQPPRGDRSVPIPTVA